MELINMDIDKLLETTSKSIDEGNNILIKEIEIDNLLEITRNW